MLKLTLINAVEVLFILNSCKGIVHPKMKIKSLITHPHAVPTP